MVFAMISDTARVRSRIPAHKGNSNVEKMMKNMVKLRAMKALAIGVASAFALMSEAATQKVGDYTYSYDLSQYGGTTGASIQPYVEPKPTGKLILPGELGGYPVRSIGQWALCDCVGLTEVTLPSSLTTIGHWAFTNCTSLTAITIPDNVNTVYDEPFLGCSQLAKVDMPSSLDGKVSKDKTFPGCRWNLTLYYRAKTADATFYYREPGTTDGTGTAWIGFGDAPAISPTTITSVKIPSELNGRPVQRIDDYSFKGCTSLTSVTIPDSVKWIGRSAFQSCSGLTSVKIPASVTSIGDYAFKDCSSLKTALLPVKMRGMNFNFVFTGCADGFAEKYFCKVIFDGNGGTSADTTFFYEDAVGPLWTPTRNGYNFLGWFTEKSGGTQVTATTLVMDDVTYYAHWEPAAVPTGNWTLKYHSNNGKNDLDTQNFRVGEPQRLYYMNSRLGWEYKDEDGFNYVFLGWAKSSTGAVAYENGELVQDLAAAGKVMHIYAVWQKRAYNVCFHSNDDRNLSKTQEFRPNIAKNLLWLDSGLGWTREGYDFLGWAKAPTSTAVVYANGQNVNNLVEQGQTLHLYAVWRDRRWTIRFHRNYSSSDNTYEDQKIPVGASVKLLWLDSQLKWTRDGYWFKGWAKSRTASAAYTNGQTVKDLVPGGQVLHLYGAWGQKTK